MLPELDCQILELHLQDVNAEQIFIYLGAIFWHSHPSAKTLFQQL